MLDVYTIDEKQDLGREARPKRETVTQRSTNGGKAPLPPVVSEGVEAESE